MIMLHYPLIEDIHHIRKLSAQICYSIVNLWWHGSVITAQYKPMNFEISQSLRKDFLRDSIHSTKEFRVTMGPLLQKGKDEHRPLVTDQVQYGPRRAASVPGIGNLLFQLCRFHRYQKVRTCPEVPFPLS